MGLYNLKNGQNLIMKKKRSTKKIILDKFVLCVTGALCHLLEYILW